jgi:hypothetical protein
MTNIVKVVFLKDGLPYGREYSFYSPYMAKIGDIVQINATAQGKVVAVNVPEEEIEAFKHTMKTILGKVERNNDEGYYI